MAGRSYPIAANTNSAPNVPRGTSVRLFASVSHAVRVCRAIVSVRNCSGVSVVVRTREQIFGSRTACATRAKQIDCVYSTRGLVGTSVADSYTDGWMRSHSFTAAPTAWGCEPCEPGTEARAISGARYR